MRSAFRFGVVALLALLAAGPAPAQFIFQREYFGRPGLLRGPGPFVRRHSTPLVVQQVRQEQPRQDDSAGYRDSGPDAARSNIEITVNVAGDAARNDAIKRAIADCRQWLEDAPRDVGSLRVAVGATIVLRVPEDPESPMGKADLSDVLDRDQVAWNYPPPNLFEVVHEDTTRAVLVLRAKAAGAHTVSAVVLPLPDPEPLPAPTKKPEPEKTPAKDAKAKKTVSKDSEESAEKKPSRPAPALTREAIRFHNFTIQVGDAVAPPGITPPPPVVDKTPPSSLDAALQAVKTAYAEERNASGMTLFTTRLKLFKEETAPNIHALVGFVNAAKGRTPRTAAAIQQALNIAPAPTAGEALRTRVARILEQLQ